MTGPRAADAGSGAGVVGDWDGPDLVLLASIAEPADEALVGAVRRWGASAVLAGLAEGAPEVRAALGGRFDGYARRLAAAGLRGGAEGLAERLAAVAVRVTTPGGSGWPSQLDDLVAPPLALFERGSHALRWVALRSVAVVGARAATDYGVTVATDLAGGVTDRGWCVVSGAAYGIDAAAHRGALASGGPTVAVLAGGVTTAYPRAHEALIARIAAEGCVVSELPPGEHPTRSRFLTRNRVIAALTAGTVVVEAALRSGARRTVSDAHSLQRVVMAVPGPVTSPMSAGCHAELRDRGAIAVTSADEVIASVGPIGQLELEPRPGAGAVLPLDGLDPDTLRVLDALRPERPRGLAAVAAEALLPPADVAAHLGLLTVLGHAERLGGDGAPRWRRAGTGRAGA